MEIILYALMAIVGIVAGHDIAKKSTVVVIEQGQIIKSVKVGSPSTILIMRDGDNLEIRNAKRADMKRFKVK
jgi:hypothetical protein